MKIYVIEIGHYDDRAVYCAVKSKRAAIKFRKESRYPEDVSITEFTLGDSSGKSRKDIPLAII